MHRTQDPGKVSLTDKESTRSPCQSISQVAMPVPGTIDFYIGIVLVLI